MKAEPTSTTANVERSKPPAAGASNHSASAATATLSAVPRSMLPALRWAGIVGRWNPPGRKTSGAPDRTNARTHDRNPMTPESRPRSSGRTSDICSR